MSTAEQLGMFAETTLAKKAPEKVPYTRPDDTRSPIVKEMEYYLQRPKVVCSKKGGLGIVG